MRTTFALYFALTVSLLACAYDGVIVQKNEEPAPFYLTLGIDGIYNFQLRDKQGVVHSQMVTPEVFCRYQIGDYFNDEQAPPECSSGFSKDDGGYIRPTHHRHHRMHRDVSSTRSKHRAHSLAARSHKRHQA